MPAPETSHRLQRALLWPATGFDELGRPTVEAAVDLQVRWKTKRTETVDDQGNAIALDATVVVDRKVTVGSVMWLAPDPTYSASGQFYGTGSAGEDTELMEVITYNEAPDLRNREVRRTVGLRKFRDTPPTLTP